MPVLISQVRVMVLIRWLFGASLSWRCASSWLRVVHGHADVAGGGFAIGACVAKRIESGVCGNRGLRRCMDSRRRVERYRKADLARALGVTPADRAATSLMAVVSVRWVADNTRSPRLTAPAG